MLRKSEPHLAPTWRQRRRKIFFQHVPGREILFLPLVCILKGGASARRASFWLLLIRSPNPRFFAWPLSGWGYGLALSGLHE